MDWCEIRNISLEAVHLAGELNVVADRESRAEADASDWRLNPSAFCEMRKLCDIRPIETPESAAKRALAVIYTGRLPGLGRVPNSDFTVLH